MSHAPVLVRTDPVIGQQKRCVKCLGWFVLELFSKHPHGRLGRDNRCKACFVEIYKQPNRLTADELLAVRKRNLAKGAGAKRRGHFCLKFNLSGSWVTAEAVANRMGISSQAVYSRHRRGTLGLPYRYSSHR